MKSVYSFLMKHGALVAMGVSVLIIFVFLLNINNGFSDLGFTSSTDLVDVIKGDKPPVINFFNFGLKITIALVIFAVFVWIIFGLIGLIFNFKGSLKFVISFAVLIILFFIFYGSSEVETTGRLGDLLADSDSYHVNEKISQYISAGIKTTLSLFGLSILTLIVSEVLSFFK